MIKTRIITLSIVFYFPIIVFCQKTTEDTNVRSDTTTYASITIEQYLDTLHNLYHYNLSYSSEFFPKDSLIHVNISNKNLSGTLNNIFNNYPLSIEINDNVIIIKPTPELHNYITIQGIIFDNKTKQPVPFANISIKNESFGTITNINGQFTFLIPKQYKSSSVLISSIGYQSIETSIPPNDTTISILLNKTSIPLQEIKVVYIPPIDLIRKVRNNIYKNYPSSPRLLEAFFREKTKKDNKYIEISEAVLNIYKDAYTKNSRDEKVKFIIGRKNISDEKLTVARLKIEGGPALFAKIDIAKSMEFISEEDIVKYEYKLVDKTIEYDHLIYIIRFTPKEETNKEEIYYSGELHIVAESYAIAYATFQLTKQTLKRANKYLIKKEAKKIKTTPSLAKYEIYYRPVGDKWTLSRTNGVLNIKMLDKRDKRIKTQYQTISELLITNSSYITSIPFKGEEIFKSNYILADKITEYNPDFWKNYNIITPEEDLINVIKKNPVKIYLIPQQEKTRH